MRNFISIKDKHGTYKPHEVSDAVYGFIRRLEFQINELENENKSLRGIVIYPRNEDKLDSYERLQQENERLKRMLKSTEEILRLHHELAEEIQNG